VVRRLRSMASSEMTRLIETGMPNPEARRRSSRFGLDAVALRALAVEAAADVACAASGGAALSAGNQWLANVTRHSSGRFDTLSYIEGCLWTVQMYVDGGCPDYAFEYAREVAPAATVVSAFLLNRLRERALAACSGSTSAGMLPIVAPRSSAQALPALVIAGLVLPSEFVSDLTGPSMGRYWRSGGQLSFETLMREEDAKSAPPPVVKADGTALAPAPMSTRTAVEEMDNGRSDSEGGGDKDVLGDSLFTHGLLARKYASFLAAAQKIPPSEEFDRCRELATRPAWLEIRRKFRKQKLSTRAPSAVAPPASSMGSAPSASQTSVLDVPSLPPDPPTDRMRPLTIQPHELHCRWVRALGRKGRARRQRRQRRGSKTK
jgi:hypothetical protein